MGTRAKKQFKISNNILFNPRYYRMFALGIFGFLMAFGASAVLTPVSSSSAQEITYQHNATGYYITVTNSDTVSLSAEATNSGTLVSASDVVNVKTNSPVGYQLYVSATNGTDGSNNLYKNGNPANAGTGYFKPVSGTVSVPATLAKNTWGFALAQDAGNSYSANFSSAEDYSPTASPTEPTTTSTWAAVPVADNAQIIRQTSSKTTTDGDNTNIYYGINATTQVISGEYSNTITYTAFSDVINDSQGTMQDFTVEKCNNIPEDSFIILTDTRDSKDYMVSHLKDGNCWMTQNLALGPVDGETDLVLTPSDSNVTAPRTIPGSSLIDGNGTEASVYDTPQIVATFQDTTDGHGSFYGNYYNWNAATATVGVKATTGTVYESICPRGWRLPDNSAYGATDETGNKVKSYTNLIGNYTVNADDTGEQMPTTNVTNAAAVARIQQAPLYFPMAGRYRSGNEGNWGKVGHYWSRTAYDGSASKAYYMGFSSNSGNFYIRDTTYDKSVARSVRCVFGENTANYMQEFTMTMCDGLTQAANGVTDDVRRALMDVRDGKLYNVSRMADGNCWMVSNLALNGVDGGTGRSRTLTSEDSNIDVTEVAGGAVTLPEGVDITSGASEYDIPQIYTADQNKTTTVCQYNSCVISNEPYGNYYNWNAATAMQGKRETTDATTIKSSICPKGWRLPDNGTAGGTKTYSNLVAGYTVNVDGSGERMPATNASKNAAAVKRIQQAPLYFPLTGHYNSGIGNQGVYSYYRTRTVYSSSDSVYNLDFNTNHVEFLPQFYYYKSSARSVRCVFGE